MLKWLQGAISLLFGFFLVACANLSLTPSTNFIPQRLFAPLSLPTPATAYRTGAGRPGPLYWQNRADYQLDTTLDTEHNQLMASAIIHYTNNSPAALYQLWLQLDQNIYRQDSRSSIASVWRRDHFTQGIILDSVELLNGTQAQSLSYQISDTRMRLDLPTPLSGHGGQLRLRFRYHYKIPGTWGGRTAVTPTKHGNIYEIAQWYPRMAVYDDLHGWNTNPYLGSEFYLEYGTFDYAVTVPWDYLVVGSGKLTNPQQVLTLQQQQRLAQAENSDKTVYIRTAEEVGDPASRPQRSGTQTWHFHMEHTRDVAFAASPSFIIDAARINLPNAQHALAMSAYPPEAAGQNKWDRSTEYVKGTIEHFSKWYPYPWPVAVNLAGHGAGMEYPGIVFDGMRDSDDFLFWISAHELGHTWFPMIVGSDERRHAFMDEGFNTFIDVYASDAFNHGEYAPKRDSEYAPGGGNPVEEILPLLADTDAPTLLNPADTIAEKYRHSLSYFKAALGLVLLREQILGPERFDRAFRQYISTWAYRHPAPSDFFRFMESAAGEDLTWWWRGWYLNNWNIDMAISKVEAVDDAKGKGTAVTLTSYQKLVMPVTLRFIYKDDSTEDFRIPVDVWRQRQNPTLVLPTTKAVKHVLLDPEHKIPDADRRNNQI